MNFRLLTPSPRVMRQGALFDYLVKISGFTLRWTSQITEYDPPRRFVDVQLKGPYSFWHHAHTFEALESGTRIVDEVNYLLPFGPLGRLAHRLMVRRQLEEIFRYRERTVERFFDSPREST